MNRADLVRMTANQAGTTIMEAEKVVAAFLESVSLALSAGEDVKLKRFGNFALRVRQPVIRKNPRTGEAMQIPETRSVSFIPGDTLKKKLNR